MKGYCLIRSFPLQKIRLPIQKDRKTDLGFGFELQRPFLAELVIYSFLAVTIVL
jgi:hypothetical protein